MFKRKLAFGFGFGAIGLPLGTFLYFLFLNLFNFFKQGNRAPSDLVISLIAITAFFVVLPSLVVGSSLLKGRNDPNLAGKIEIGLGVPGLVLGLIILVGDIDQFMLHGELVTVLLFTIGCALLLASGIMFKFVSVKQSSKNPSRSIPTSSEKES